jgi:hypothetical protein
MELLERHWLLLNQTTLLQLYCITSTISQQPADGKCKYFNDNGDSYQWQLSTNGNWADVSNTQRIQMLQQTP